VKRHLHALLKNYQSFISSFAGKGNANGKKGGKTEKEIVNL